MQAPPVLLQLTNKCITSLPYRSSLIEPSIFQSMIRLFQIFSFILPVV
nr:MAG TPA: hypothetical protein [Caudoviricetes sp.]